MNIIIGKIGRSISSNPKNWSAIGGDNEPFIIYDKLARMFSTHTFYLIGKSDFSRNKNYKKPSNMIDVWAYFNKSMNEEEFINNYLKDKKIDLGILMAGPVGTINCSNRDIKKVKTPDEKAKPLGMFIHYVSPIYNYLNDSKIPWICLGPDPRYFNFGKDLLNPPKKILSQYNGEKLYSHFESFENQLNKIEERIPIIYTGLEKTFLISKKKPSFYKKTEKFVIVLNEGGNGGLLRGPMLKEYILDNDLNDVKIYGKWSENWYSDNRFKGPKKFEELQPLLYNTKYTFIIPIMKGWATAKFWEMTYYGIIPFMHPYYDSQKNISVSDFIRVNSPKELKEKIEFLDSNQEEYEKLLKELRQTITDKDLSGEVLLNRLMTDTLKIIGENHEYISFQNETSVDESFFRFM